MQAAMGDNNVAAILFEYAGADGPVSTGIGPDGVAWVQFVPIDIGHIGGSSLLRAKTKGGCSASSRRFSRQIAKPGANGRLIST
jgi:hypothetical protein